MGSIEEACSRLGIGVLPIPIAVSGKRALNLDSGGKGTLLWEFAVRSPEWIQRSTSSPLAPGSRFIPPPPSQAGRASSRKIWEKSYSTCPHPVYTGCNQSELGVPGLSGGSRGKLGGVRNRPQRGFLALGIKGFRTCSGEVCLPGTLHLRTFSRGAYRPVTRTEAARDSEVIYCE